MDRYLQTSFSIHSTPSRLAWAVSVCFQAKCLKWAAQKLISTQVKLSFSKPQKFQNQMKNYTFHQIYIRITARGLHPPKISDFMQCYTYWYYPAWYNWYYSNIWVLFILAAKKSLLLNKVSLYFMCYDKYPAIVYLYHRHTLCFQRGSAEQIITLIHCRINTEKFVLHFASQWYNYYYYYFQTCAADYYKNVELLFAISPL